MFRAKAVTCNMKQVHAKDCLGIRKLSNKQQLQELETTLKLMHVLYDVRIKYNYYVVTLMSQVGNGVAVMW